MDHTLKDLVFEEFCKLELLPLEIVNYIFSIIPSFQYATWEHIKCSINTFFICYINFNIMVLNAMYNKAWLF